jgi:ferric-dicitrate binding protein FerR (iron transport regulator)
MLTSHRSFEVVVCMVAFAGPALSQSVLQFDRWMQRIDRHSQSIQRNLAMKDPVAAMADARELGKVYGLMKDYFARRGDANDAVKLSRDGAALADAAVKSIQVNDFEAASQTATSLARACRDCHVKYKPLSP